MPDGERQTDDSARLQGPNPEALIGKVIGGKYRVDRILGRGGMGTIYVAEQQPLGRKIALKILHSALTEGGADPEFKKRFLLEAAVLSKLTHPNIVVVHDYGNVDGDEASCFMAMELLEGQTIHDLLGRDGPFTTARALRVAREIARALRAAHQEDVVHRDLKPSNVMLCRSAEGETVKVLDFGLVKVLRDDSEELTAEGRFLGSPRYMSPEQIQRLPMDGRSDLYSLGVILYRMLTGEVPFLGDSAITTLLAHLNEPIPRIEAKTGVAVPAPVEAIVRRLLEKEPERRYRDADALIAAIDEVWPQVTDEPPMVSGEHVVRVSVGEAPRASTEDDVPTVPPPADAAPPERRWLLPGLAVVGVAIGLGGAAALAAWLDAPDPAPVTAPTPPEPAPEPPPDEPVVAPPQPAPATFTLTVRSVPPGATVLRDGADLGVTPLSLTLDPATLEAAPARFELRLAGHQPATFEQGPSDANVDVERALAPIRTPRPRPRPPPEGPRGGDLSIKTQR